MSENRSAIVIVTEALVTIFNGFLFTVGGILAVLLFSWLGYSPFK